MYYNEILIGLTVLSAIGLPIAVIGSMFTAPAPKAKKDNSAAVRNASNVKTF